MFVTVDTVSPGDLYYYFLVIRILQRGTYKLIACGQTRKVLVLDDTRMMIWHNDEVSLSAESAINAKQTVKQGFYRLYEVQGEHALSDSIHMELSLGKGVWQGYLLNQGLPQNIKDKRQILPTPERITVKQELFI